jgi:hypothetical protein
MNEIVRIAEKEVGQGEKPLNSNKTKYGKWFGFDGVAWCGMFVSWCYAQAGFPLPKIGFTKGFAGCQTAVAYFKKNNQITNTPAPGDIVFFDWNRDGRFDHTGIFVRWINNKEFETIEGNTAVGNDSNGGTVMRRKRDKTKATIIFVNVPV